MPSNASAIHELPADVPSSPATLWRSYWPSEDNPPKPPDLQGTGNGSSKLKSGQVLSVEYPVPSAIRNAIQPKYRDVEGGVKELETLRYTAVTADPDDFTLDNGYNIRPAMYRRHTEHLVCVTYYNEDKALLSKTLHSLFMNLRDIANLKKSEFWNGRGPSWQKLVICVVMDGIEACDEAVLDVLATIGLYQDGIMVPDVDGREVTAHVFECTTQLSINANQQLIRPLDDSPQTLPPVQMMLCMKTKNAGKINSYRWIYKAFGRMLNPEIVCNIDTGTYLGPRALLRLWEAFYYDDNLGAACGAVQADLGGRRWNRDLLNPLVATQNFEYKLAVQLERSMEASTGYLSVLPGAFSGYRYRAAMGRPLNAYFYGDPTLKTRIGSKTPDHSIYRLNRFLADDRILAFELVIKKGAKWHTDIVHSAVAFTDIPANTTDFINQRRRWLNGAFFATLYSLHMVTRIWASGHSRLRIPFLFLQLFHNTLAFILAWFSLSGYLLTVFIVNDITGDPPPDAKAEGFPLGRATPIVNAVIQVVYILAVVFQFLLALGSRPKGQVASYVASFAVFAVVQLYMLMNLVYLTKRLVDFRLDAEGGSNYAFINGYYSDVGQVTVIVTGVSVFGVYIAAGIVSYTNILNIYAFSNVHDVSWGEKSGKKGPIERTPTFRDGRRVVERTNEQEPGQSHDKSGRGRTSTGPDVRTVEDIDIKFEEVVKRALTPHERHKVVEEDDPRAKFMRFRTRLVAAYIFSNFLVCIIVLDQTFQGFYAMGDPYWHRVWFFRIWMWGNSALLLMKFAGMA
ncbi:Chitin synthase, class 3 [Diaporthe australafricana]|uniref:Chitin synthase n=1 Tax=Diaporthe australafricana TaxID=127596 RepID=A0ABR3XPT1_9PEZI